MSNEWEKYEFHVLETLKSYDQRLKTLEDRERTGQRDNAITKTKIAFFSGIAGVIGGGLISVLIKVLVP
jgi:hypothetical protein